jgi:hypothetical protein
LSQKLDPTEKKRVSELKDWAEELSDKVRQKDKEMLIIGLRL